MSETTTKRRISYTQYSMWSSCPYQWKLAYVDKLKPKDSSIELIFGTSMHEAIQQWLSHLFEQSRDYADAFDMNGFFKSRLMDLFKEQIREHPETKEKVFLCDKNTLKEYYEDGVAILEYLRDHQDVYFPTKSYTLVGIETELAIPLTEQLDFTGFIDVLIYNADDDVYTIIDLKTSGKGWTSWQKNDDKKVNQILLYKKFYSDQFNVPLKNIKTEFIILTRKVPKAGKRIEQFVPDHSKLAVKKADLSFQHFLRTTFDDAGDVKVGNLPPTPSKSNCMFCFAKTNAELCSASYYLGK